MIEIRQPASIAARTLTIVGSILFVAYFLDLILLIIPPNFLNRAWQIAVTTQVVERGILPLVGIALIFAGFGLENTIPGTVPKRKSVMDIKFWVLILASLLGLMFLLIFPLHLNNTRLERNEQLSQISNRATQAENLVKNQADNETVQKEIEQQRGVIKSQLTEVLKDEQRLNEAIKSGQVPPQQAELFKQLRNNPEAIDQFVNQQLTAENLAERELTRIRGEKQRQEEQTKLTSLKSGLQTGISSLLLAFGYIAIGWTGLKNLGYIKVGRRSTPPRV
jgi:hypothetical protein